MFSLIHKGSPLKVFSDEGPALVLALAASEMFFKFHSFILECIAFLSVWYALGAAVWVVRSTLAARQG